MADNREVSRLQLLQAVDRLNASVKKLDESTTRLTKINNSFAAVMLVVAVVGLILSFRSCFPG